MVAAAFHQQHVKQLLHAARMIGAGQQVINELRPFIGPGFVEKLLRFRRRGNSPGEIEIDAANEFGVVRPGLQWNSVGLGPRGDQVVDLPM
jgi:hypothetical protein